jgi:hypothetical protein
MSSVLETKCPACGVESGPCFVERGVGKYCESRILAANPTTYEYPDCGECRKLKDTMVSAAMSVRTCRPDGDYKPKSRWTTEWTDELHRREKEASLTRSKYEFHLQTDHDMKK